MMYACIYTQIKIYKVQITKLNTCYVNLPAVNVNTYSLCYLTKMNDLQLKLMHTYKYTYKIYNKR